MDNDSIYIQDLSKVNTEFNPAFEQNSDKLQRESFGGHYFDDVTARKKATEDLYRIKEDGILKDAMKAISEGSTAAAVKDILDLKKPDNITDDISLEMLSEENSEQVAIGLADKIIQNDKDLDFKNKMKNTNINAKILETKSVEAKENYDSLGLYNKFIELGQQLLPGWNAMESAKAMDITTTDVLPSASRGKQQKVMQQAMETLSPEEFKTYCDMIDNRMIERGISKTGRQEFWEDMRATTTITNDLFLFADMLDVGAVGDFLFKGSRVAGKGGKVAAKRAENLLDAKAAKTVESTVPEVKQLSKTEEEELVQLTTSTSLKPDGKLSNAAEVNNKVAKNAIDDEMIRELDEWVVVKDEGFNSNINNDIEIFKRGIEGQFNFGKNELVQYDLTMVGDRTVNLKVGHGANRNSPFATREAAETFAKKHAIEGTYSIEALPEGFYVNIQTPLPQVAVSFKDLKTDNSWKEWSAKGWARWFSTLKKSEKAHKYEVVTTRAQDKARQYAQNLSEYVTRLKKDEAKTLDIALQESSAECKWFSEETLRSTYKFNDNQVEAYDAVKKANDLQYYVTNAELKHNLDLQGYKVINKNGERFVGKHVSPSNINISDATIYNTVTDTYIKPGEVNKKELLELLGDDKVLLKRRSAGDYEGTPYKYVIAKREGVKVEELPEYILKYLPGPRRFYAEGTLFAKQARSVSKLGKELVIHPRTLKAGLDKKSMYKWSDEMNGVLEEYRKVKNKTITKEEFTQNINMTTADNDYIHVASYEDFDENYIKKFNMDYKNDIEIVEDGDVLKGDQMARQRGAGFFDDPEEYQTSTLQDMFDDNADTFYSRGDRLTTPDGDVSPLVSPRRLMEKTLNKMIYDKTSTAYNKWASNEFKKMFYDVIDFNPDHPYMGAREFLESVSINTNQKTLQGRNKANAAIHFLRNWRNLSVQTTPWDRFVNNYMKGLADFLGDRGLLVHRGDDLYESLSKMRPDKFLQSLVFQSKLGLWNIRQGWLQATGALQLSLLEPTLAPKTFAQYGALRLAMHTDSPEVLSRLAKAAGKLTKNGGRDFADRVKLLKKMNAYGADQLSTYAPGRSVLNPNKFKQSSTMFFREGERFNFLSANNIAIDKYLSKHPDMSIQGLLKNDEAITDMIAYSDHLYLNMSRASQMGSQAGVGSMFMQFARYPFAFMEALFNKQFTGAQRARLLLGDLALFGVEGTIGYSAYNKLVDNDFLNMTPDQADAINKGALTYAANELGIPVDLSEIGPQTLQPFSRIISKSGTVDIFSQVPVLSVGGTIGDTLKLFKKIATEYIPSHNDVDVVSELQWMATSELPSSLKNTAKAFLVDYVGKLYSKNYVVLTDKLGPSDALLKGMGFRLKAESNLEELIKANQDFTKTTKELAEEPIKLYRKWQANPNDERAKREYKAMMTTTMGMLRDHPAEYKEVNRLMAEEFRERPLTLDDKMLLSLARKQGYKKAIEYRNKRVENN